MMKKRIWSLLTGILLVFLCFTAVSCENDLQTDTTEDTSMETAADTVQGDVTITSGNTSLYKIIRGEDVSDEMVGIAIKFRRGLEEVTGVDFAFSTDWSVDGSVGEGALEILVGATNRPESIAVSESLRTMEYAIRIVGNKIVVYGSSAQTLEAAVDEFLRSDILSLNAEGNYVVSGEPVKDEIKLADGQLPLYPDGEISIYASSGDTFVMKAVGTAAETYKEYLKELEADGFGLYTENVIENNLFATYTNDNLAVNAYYIDNNKTVRVVWESLGLLPGLESDNIYDTSTTADTLLTGIDVAEGMSYVYRLCDNSFIIFDGGRIDPDEADADELMEILTEQTPEGEKPVIAAWMFSHPHGDHLGVSNYFILKYHDAVEVEQIYYNFANDEDIWAVDPQVLDPSYYEKLGYHYWEYCSGYYFFRHIEEYLPDVKIVKPHTGNRYYIRNAEVEILGTVEDLYPKTIVTTGEGGNAQTVTYRVYIEDQSFLMLGDASPTDCDLIVEQFGDYVKSDVMQMSHHGGYGGTINLYTKVDPTYTLLPTTFGGYFGVIDSELNQVLVNSENMKQMFVSGFGTYSVRLPINPEGEYDRIPDRRTKNPDLFE